MAHITFIHGISNKPPKDKLLRIWCDSLAESGGIELGAEGVTSSMVYWADVLYPDPIVDSQLEKAENLENEAEVARRSAAKDPDMSWRENLQGEEKRIVDSLARKLSFDVLANDDFIPPGAEIDRQLERIPLPWFVKRRVMKEFLRDVHHFLFNESFSPRDGQTYRVQDEIRKRIVAAFNEGAAKPGPHVVVGHSLGSVIAYDCLQRVPGCAAVDGLMTVGSPLGIDEVQDKLAPEWTRENGFPTKVRGAWVNVFDIVDPVTGFDGNIANDFKRSGKEVIEVINEPNSGAWRHSISKYFAGPKLRASLRAMLKIEE
jgi:hypothetical protein